MSDLISRQAAIDELPYLLGYDGLKGENGFVSKRLVRTMLKSLPPAEPKIIRCKDCKEFRRWIDTDIEFCDRTGNRVSENDFCSMAERREE